MKLLCSHERFDSALLAGVVVDMLPRLVHAHLSMLRPGRLRERARFLAVHGPKRISVGRHTLMLTGEQGRSFKTCYLSFITLPHTLRESC